MGAGSKPVADTSDPREMLVLDTEYSWATLRSIGAEAEVTSRDVEGFFSHVWHVNPLVGANSTYDRSVAFGPPTVRHVRDDHTFIEGRVRRHHALRRFPVLDFLASQISLGLLLARRIRGRRVVAVRADDPFFLGLFGLLVARVLRAVFLVRLNGNYDSLYRATGPLAYPRLLRDRAVEVALSRIVLRAADGVLLINEDHRDYALRNGAAHDRVRVVGLGRVIAPIHREPPHNRVPVAQELGLDSLPVTTCVSRLEEVKHVKDCIHVLRCVAEEAPDLHLVLIGEGSQRDQLEALAKAVGLQERVHFVGRRTQGWIARLLAEALVALARILHQGEAPRVSRGAVSAA